MRKRASVVIDVLSVIFLLGLIAAVAIPDTSVHSVKARDGALQSALVVMRTAIDDYAAEHGRYPGIDQLSAIRIPSVVAAVGLPQTVDMRPITGIHLDAIPENPFSGGNTIGLPGSAPGSTDWIYDETNGDLRANDSVDHRNL